MAKTRQANFRFTLEFDNAIREAAARDGRNATQWLEHRLRPILERELGRSIGASQVFTPRVVNDDKQ